MSDKDLIKEISVVNFNAGDTVVISCDQILKTEQRDRIKSLASDAFDGVKVLVLDGGLKMTVVSETLSIPPIEAPIFNGEKMHELEGKIKNASDV